ncbi:MAG: hypothetical protein WA211_12600 [Candidatus Acidiferrales bacterium]
MDHRRTDARWFIMSGKWLDRFCSYIHRGLQHLPSGFFFGTPNPQRSNG